LIPKGREGAAQMLRLMRQGLHFGAMMDQKLNEGIAVPFFGHDAMTATAPVEIALRTGGPIVPVRCVRLPDSRFRIEVLPPLAFGRTEDRKADTMRILRQINEIMEGWIREYPEQWFWLHRRWPKE
jgi:KDO2-lipid IV(A) lauroyltransferase